MKLTRQELKTAILEIYKGIPMKSSSIRFCMEKLEEYKRLANEIREANALRTYSGRSFDFSNGEPLIENRQSG